MINNNNLEKVAELKSKFGSVRSNAATQVEGVERFVSAQKGIWDVVLFELRAGEKRGHWMWYIFPQIIGIILVGGRCVRFVAERECYHRIYIKAVVSGVFA